MTSQRVVNDDWSARTRSVAMNVWCDAAVGRRPLAADRLKEQSVMFYRLRLQLLCPFQTWNAERFTSSVC